MDKRLQRPNARGLAGAGALVVTVGLATVVALVGNPLAASGAPKPPKTSTPTISAGPSGPTASTSATFTFSGPSGSTMRCSLDTGAFVTCPSPTSASYTGLAQGAHTFRVTAQQSGKSVSDPATRTWTVDTVAPPLPTITKAPETDDPQTAQFKLASSESGVDFQCRLDDDAFGSCGSTANFNGLQEGDHCFRARSADAAGNLSSVREHCWTVVVKQAFAITGDVDGVLAPGVEQPLDLRLANPNNVDIRVLEIEVAIAASNPACVVADMEVLQGGSPVTDGTLTFADLVVPKKATRTLSQLGVPAGELVSVRFVNTAQNQDACKNNTLTLTYTGTATK